MTKQRQLKTCLKCDYQWLSAINPKYCTNCHSKEWNKIKENPFITHDDEVYLPIQRFFNMYLISNYGNLYSCITSKNIASRCLNIVIEGKSYTISHLLLETFKPITDWRAGKRRIKYLDGDRYNIKLSNLEWH